MVRWWRLEQFFCAVTHLFLGRKPSYVDYMSRLYHCKFLFTSRVLVWDVDKDDIVYRKEVTSQLASLAAMFENLLTAICG